MYIRDKRRACVSSRTLHRAAQTVFTGTLIVVPDSSALARVGEATVGAKPPGRRGAEGPDAGVTGLKKLGVKELTYRSVFVSSSVCSVFCFRVLFR